MIGNDRIFQCTKEEASPEDGIIEGKWYFVKDIIIYGPFNLEQEAREALDSYQPMELLLEKRMPDENG